MLVNKEDLLTRSTRKSLTDYFYKNADADELIFIHKENYAPCWVTFL
jgi:homogentisate 1,2-dioxygenase